LNDQVFFSAFFNQFGQRVATSEGAVTDRNLLVIRILQLATCRVERPRSMGRLRFDGAIPRGVSVKFQSCDQLKF
jgi:hypothetical protein